MQSFAKYLSEQRSRKQSLVDPALDRELMRIQVKHLNKQLAQIAAKQNVTFETEKVRNADSIKTTKDLKRLGYEYAILINDSDHAAVIIRMESNIVIDLGSRDWTTFKRSLYDFRTVFYPTQIFGIKLIKNP